MDSFAKDYTQDLKNSIKTLNEKVYPIMNKLFQQAQKSKYDAEELLNILQSYCNELAEYRWYYANGTVHCMDYYEQDIYKETREHEDKLHELRDEAQEIVYSHEPDYEF